MHVYSEQRAKINEMLENLFDDRFQDLDSD